MKKVFLIIISILFNFNIYAQEINNMTVNEGKSKIIIEYELTTSNPVFIEVFLSEDGGVNFSKLASEGLKGDVGRVNESGHKKLLFHTLLESEIANNKNYVFEVRAKNIEIPTLKDKRDGKEYKTVSLGKQVWMAENLAFLVKTGNAWAYNNDDRNIEKFGYLYDWETAKKACPLGWHLPTKEDFIILEKHLQQIGSNYASLITEENSNFNALFCGFRDSSGHFGFIGKETWFWSASKHVSYYSSCLIISKLKPSKLDINIKTLGFSVRCIQN